MDKSEKRQFEKGKTRKMAVLEIETPKKDTSEKEKSEKGQIWKGQI